MKSIRIISALFCFLSFTAIHAQESAFGIKGGLNLSTMSTKGNDDKNLNPGFHAGIFDKIAFSENFAIQPELMYSTQGLKINYEGLVDGETKFNLNYINLPVNLVFNLTDNLWLQAGPYIGYLINAKMKSNAEVISLFEINSEDVIDRKNFNTLDYGIATGLGFGAGPVIFGVNYNFGLNVVAKDNEPIHAMLGDAKNNVLQIYVGIKFL